MPSPDPAGGAPDRPLGCSRCRWSRKGCSRCRNPQFRPRVPPADRGLSVRLAASAARSSTARLAAVQARRHPARDRGASRDVRTDTGDSEGGSAPDERSLRARVSTPVWPQLPKAPVTPPSSPDSSLGSFGSSVLAELQAFAAERGDAEGAVAERLAEERRGGEEGAPDEGIGEGHQGGESDRKGHRGGESDGKRHRGGESDGKGHRGGESVALSPPPALLASTLGALHLTGARRGLQGDMGGDGLGKVEDICVPQLKRPKLERVSRDRSEAVDGGTTTRGAGEDATVRSQAGEDATIKSQAGEEAATNGQAGEEAAAEAEAVASEATLEDEVVDSIGPEGAMTGRGDPNPRRTKRARTEIAQSPEENRHAGPLATAASASAGPVASASVSPPAPAATSRGSPLRHAPDAESGPSVPATPARKRRPPPLVGDGGDNGGGGGGGGGEDHVTGAEPSPARGAADAGPLAFRGTPVPDRLASHCPRSVFSAPPAVKRLRPNASSTTSGARVSRWTPPASPWGLVEEELWRDPWRLLVACVLLNKTRGDAARKILLALFRAWPTAEALASGGYEVSGAEGARGEVASRPREVAGSAAASEAPPHNEALTLARLSSLLQPLGLHRRRAASLIAMSRAYLQGDWVEARDLPGVGPYADDAFRIFCLGRWRDTIPQDKDLKRYRDFLVETHGQGLGLQPPPEYWSAETAPGRQETKGAMSGCKGR